MCTFSAKAAAKAPVKPDSLSAEGKAAWDEVSKLGNVVRELKSNKADKVSITAAANHVFIIQVITQFTFLLTGCDPGSCATFITC